MKEHKVCKLKKAVYGLKQGSRWNKKIDKGLTNLGFKRSTADACVYHKNQGENILLIGVYVDDMLIFSNQKQRRLSKKSSKKNSN